MATPSTPLQHPVFIGMEQHKDFLVDGVSDYTLVSAILRRSKVSSAMLSATEERIGQQKSLVDLLFTEELLDLVPDIFPPHLVAGFIERNPRAGVKSQDTWESYLTRMSQQRDLSTLRMMGKQIRSAAKADATRRTTAVHPVRFGDSLVIPMDSERYFVFPEQHAEETIGSLEGTLGGRVLRERITNYEHSSGSAVPRAFFGLMDAFALLDANGDRGLSVRREAKHKYPIHGLLYGATASLPESIRQRMESAGQLVLGNMLRNVDPAEALSFSIDFFLDPSGEIWIGRDVHEQQIGMGLLRQFNVDPAKEFYDALANCLKRRAPNRLFQLSMDTSICEKNQLYRNEVAALTQALRQRGLYSGDTGYTLRLFGGTTGVPTENILALTDDKLLIDDALEVHRATLADIGIRVPRTYRTTARMLADSPSDAVAAIGTTEAFVHPIVHHGFKPFGVDLASNLTRTVIQETFSRPGNPLDKQSVVVMERIPNLVSAGGKQYPHEVRAYFVPTH